MVQIMFWTVSSRFYYEILLFRAYIAIKNNYEVMFGRRNLSRLKSGTCDRKGAWIEKNGDEDDNRRRRGKYWIWRSCIDRRGKIKKWIYVKVNVKNCLFKALIYGTLWWCIQFIMFRTELGIVMKCIFKQLHTVAEGLYKGETRTKGR